MFEFCRLVIFEKTFVFTTAIGRKMMMQPAPKYHRQYFLSTAEPHIKSFLCTLQATW